MLLKLCKFFQIYTAMVTKGGGDSFLITSALIFKIHFFVCFLAKRLKHKDVFLEESKRLKNLESQLEGQICFLQMREDNLKDLLVQQEPFHQHIYNNEKKIRNCNTFF